MSTYKVESWDAKRLAAAFRDVHSEGDERVVIPIFQRGLRWEEEKRRLFIDSLDKGYPFGSLLLAQQGVNKYAVVDGLQRGSTITDYIYHPLGQANLNKIDDYIVDEINKALYPDDYDESRNAEIEKTVLGLLHEIKDFSFDNVKFVNNIIEKFPNNGDLGKLILKINEIISPFILKLQKRHDEIKNANIPIVIYTGSTELLPIIFERINKQGAPLTDYEIYAATWSREKFFVNTTKIVDKVIDKYKTILDKGYTIDGYSIDEMKISQELTAFEYLFGLGKYWEEKYECLKLSNTESNSSDVNEIGFEIFDACINDAKKIALLDKTILEKEIDINLLQKRIEEAIEFVSSSIMKINSFKGSKRAFSVLHSKYQIVALVSYAFREMYSYDSLDERKRDLTDDDKNLYLAHYIYDIISGEWQEGGGSKVYTSIKDKRFSRAIENDTWESLISNYYVTQKQENKQASSFQSPSIADKIILNCIYLDKFTADDQLNSTLYDIEHLATKEKMRILMSKYDDFKLPVTNIANLCYLEEGINRGKKQLTIYEAPALKEVITNIEEKFSFTKESDLAWINIEYSDSFEDRDLLQSNYISYLDSRFEIIKQMFLDMVESL